MLCITACVCKGGKGAGASWERGLLPSALCRVLPHEQGRTVPSSVLSCRFLGCRSKEKSLTDSLRLTDGQEQDRTLLRWDTSGGWFPNGADGWWGVMLLILHQLGGWSPSGAVGIKPTLHPTVLCHYFPLC